MSNDILVSLHGLRLGIGLGDAGKARLILDGVPIPTNADVYPSGTIKTGVGPLTFDGTSEKMEVNASAALTVNIITGKLLAFRTYVIYDGANNAGTNNITLAPDVGTMNNPVINENGGARLFLWNGSAIKVIG